MITTACGGDGTDAPMPTLPNVPLPSASEQECIDNAFDEPSRAQELMTTCGDADPNVSFCAGKGGGGGGGGGELWVTEFGRKF